MLPARRALRKGQEDQGALDHQRGVGEMDRTRGSNFLEPGATFGRFRILGPIGDDPDDRVYKAVPAELRDFERPVALKLFPLPPGCSCGSGQEPAGLVMPPPDLKHPNLADWLETSRVGRQCYAATGYVDGVSLARLAARASEMGISLPPGARIRIALQVAMGLEYLHELGDGSVNSPKLVHGNIRPSRVMLQRNGIARLLFYGFTRDGAHPPAINGLPMDVLRCMAPEQVQGDGPLTQASDVYSMAVVSFEIATGEPMLPCPTNTDSTPRQIYDQQFSALDLDSRMAAAEGAIPGLGQLLRPALEPDPSTRLSRIAPFVAGLEDLSTRNPLTRDLVEFVRPFLPEPRKVENPYQPPAVTFAVAGFALDGVDPETIHRPPCATPSGIPTEGQLRAERHRSDAQPDDEPAGTGDTVVPMAGKAALPGKPISSDRKLLILWGLAIVVILLFLLLVNMGS